MAKRKKQKTKAVQPEQQRNYTAAQPSQYRKSISTSRSPDGVMDAARGKIRDIARYLDENHDLVIGILNELVDKVIGPGLIVEPVAKDRSGQLASEFNTHVRNVMKRWYRRPDTTGETPGDELDRLICRTWLRDGESFIRHVDGLKPVSSNIPYCIELIEPDYLPFEHCSAEPPIVHGIEKDGWGRPVAFHFYRNHPGNSVWPMVGLNGETRRVPADQVIHMKFTRRFRQTRGVSILHGVISRLYDLMDYEESERIAARVAASLTAFIRRSPDVISDTPSSTDRTWNMDMGMIIDNLLPGEDIGTIGTDRPNIALETYRKGQLKAAASGVGASYSSVARDYDGTYSSQRQEMVEANPGYARLRSYFIESYKRPVIERAMMLAISTGVIRVPRSVDQDTVMDVDIRGPGIPWIDPKKEIEADGLAIQYGLKSRHQVIRERGGNPAQVDLELESDDFERDNDEPQTQDQDESQEDVDMNSEDQAA